MTSVSGRLKDVRERAGFATASEAARRFGWAEQTYFAHENGNRGLKPAVAKAYAEAFGVAPEWLLYGSSAGLGDIIRDARKKKGWTQGYVGEHLQVSPSAVSMWESGTFKPALPMLVGLSKLFDIPTDTLLAAFPADFDGAALEPPPAASPIEPVLQAVWEKMSPKQRRKLVQIAVIIAEDK